MADGYDVVVVGAGPAGASAARAAARGGAHTLLLERARLPRYKTCGGGLLGVSADVAELSEADFEPVVRERVSRVSLTLNGGWAVHRRSRDDQPLFRLVNRADFDHALTVDAVRSGAELRTEATVVGVEDDRSGVLLQLRGQPPIRARAVIAADGSASRLSRYVGVRTTQVDLGLEGEFPAPDDRWARTVLLDWGPVPGSYGWVFPKGDVLTVGVIGAGHQAAELRRYYASFVSRLGLGAVTPLIDTGHLTRVRAPDSPLRRGCVLAAGDAAGLLEPWTREGISFALRSGRLAGEAAAAGRTAGYPLMVERILTPEMSAGRTLLQAFAASPLLFHLLLAGPGFGLFARLLDGRSTYARQLRRPAAQRVLERLARSAAAG
jgi:geranylgeranyl reductase family protein